MFKRLLFFIIIVAPILLFARKEALIVAVGIYKNPTIPRLNINPDVNKIVHLLRKRGFHITILKNQNATFAKVVRQLQSYHTLSSNDVFVFYDTSHGVQIHDDNGDEADGKDECFVLYDTDAYNQSITDSKRLLVDDELDVLLSRIPAKKLMIIDACHSGSIYKGLSEFRIKGLNIDKNFHNYKKRFLSRRDLAKPSNLIAISASSDDEVSVDNVFTDALYKTWNKYPNISFKDLRDQTARVIRQEAKRNQPLQKPQLYTSNNQSSSELINLYIQDIEGYLNMVMHSHRVEKFGLYSRYKRYRVGSHIKFKIDTHNRKGHLYILNIRDKHIDRIYPNSIETNSRISRSKFIFPSRFDIEATISNPYLRKERTLAYAILSDRVIDELEYPHKVTFRTLREIFGNPNNNSWLNRFFGRKLSIARSQFYVIR